MTMQVSSFIPLVPLRAPMEMMMTKTKTKTKLEAKTVGRIKSVFSTLVDSVDPRFSMPQALFLMEVAHADALGKETTYSEVKATFGEKLSKGLHSSYKVLLVPDGRTTERSLGFVERTVNPNNRREMFLTLTDSGRAVVAKMVDAFGGTNDS